MVSTQIGQKEATEWTFPIYQEEKKSSDEAAKTHDENKSFIREIEKRAKLVLVLNVTPQAAKVTTTVCAKCLAKMKKTLNLWVEDSDRKRVLIHGTVLCQKALSLWKLFSKGFPEKSDTKPLTESRSDYTDSGVCLD